MTVRYHGVPYWQGPDQNYIATIRDGEQFYDVFAVHDGDKVRVKYSDDASCVVDPNGNNHMMGVNLMAAYIGRRYYAGELRAQC